MIEIQTGGEVMTPRKLTIERVAEVFQSKGLRLLDTEVKGTRDKYNCVDKYGYMYYTRYRNIFEGNKPEAFSLRNPYTIQNIRLWLKLDDIPYELISDEYMGSNVKMKWRRTRDKQLYYATWSHFLSGGRATREEYWASKSEKMLNTSYNTDKKMTEVIVGLMRNTPEWEIDGDIEALYCGVDCSFPLVHKDGYKSQTSLSGLRAGYKPSLFLIANQEMKDFNIYKIVSKESNYTLKKGQSYKGSGVKYTFICKTHGEFENTLYHVVSGGYCPQCGLDARSKENHIFWNDNKSEEERVKERKSLEYRRWRTAVFERDDYTCQTCDEKGGRLHAHHLDGYHWCKERRFDLENGVSLCKYCHSAFHNQYGRRNITEKDWLEWLAFIRMLEMVDKDAINRIKQPLIDQEKEMKKERRKKSNKEEGVGGVKLNKNGG